MATETTVLAVWNGPHGYALQATGEELVPGETIVEIPIGEAIESPRWEPVEPIPAPKEPGVKELRELAAEQGIEVPKGAKKADIQALLEDHALASDSQIQADLAQADQDVANGDTTPAADLLKETS